MMNKFTLVLNAGRSGSTFLQQILKANYASECYIAHEDIPVQISKPRIYNRAYSTSRISEILKDDSLIPYLDKWQAELQKHPVIETGWTAYHLCPLLYHLFKDRFQVIIMHRDPIRFAFSRANMGNYHIKTFYDDAHEVTPFDKFTIAPQKKNIWHEMNHFERCMYWWWVVYQEGLEFKEKHPEVPSISVKSADIFSYKRLNEVLEFMTLDPSKLLKKDVGRNGLAQFMRESFPIEDEWRAYMNHPDILNFGENIGGYKYTIEELEEVSKKYKLPAGLGPAIRNKTNYWKIKSKLSQPFKGNDQ